MVLHNHSGTGLLIISNISTPPKPLLILTTLWRPKPPKSIKYTGQVCASGWRLGVAIPVPYLHGLSLNIHLLLMLHGLLQVSFMLYRIILCMTLTFTRQLSEAEKAALKLFITLQPILNKQFQASLVMKINSTSIQYSVEALFLWVISCPLSQIYSLAVFNTGNVKRCAIFLTVSQQLVCSSNFQ